MVSMYEFTHKDKPFLKKDIVARVLFGVAFLVVFIWQFILLVVNYTAGTLTGLMMGVAIFTMLTSLLIGIVTALYAYRSIVTVGEINKKGTVVRRVNLLGQNAKKGSFIKMYNVLSQILAVVMLMVFASGLTYAILELVYYSTHSFYLPVLLLVTISGFNGVYHLQTEIHTIREVAHYNRAF
ncbi:MAG TPA: hypothetical protein IAB72_03120 [Candidatus Onthoplasma faecipullorum]|nr:hypothetical protein [Candidatus Onthoplasma faecipullorum]